MARDPFDHSLDVRQQYLSLVYHSFPGSGTWTLINQGRTVSPSQSADEQEYSRIGDKSKLKVAGTITTDVTVQIYVEDSLAELAMLIGDEVIGAGWAGTEEIQLDPTVAHDLKIVNFDGITAASNILSNEYVNEFKPFNLGPPLEAEGDVRVADISGAAASYYIVPEAT
jgi:hypothetical protein